MSEEKKKNDVRIDHPSLTPAQILKNLETKREEMKKRQQDLRRNILPKLDKEFDLTVAKVRNCREKLKSAQKQSKCVEEKVRHNDHQFQMVCASLAELERKILQWEFANRKKGGYLESVKRENRGYTPRGDDDFAEEANEVCKYIGPK